MEYTKEQTIELVEITATLMLRAGIPVRDTWKGYQGENVDDEAFNKGKAVNTRLFKIVETTSGGARIGGHNRRELTGFKSIAYDSYKAYIPARLSHLKHPVIHEIVHFLQHTMTLDDRYIESDGDNYEAYVGQDCEIQAHFVQLLYISEYELELKEPGDRIDFRVYLEAAFQDPAERFNCIKFAHKLDVFRTQRYNELLFSITGIR
jgi:hypothetical protein